MKNQLFNLLIISLLLTCISCKNSSQFFSDRNYRQTVDSLFEKRKAELPEKKDALYGIFDRADIPENQKEAMKFLYAYMSLNDLADYNGDFFYKQVHSAFEAREYFAWGKKVPEDLFRHFVLPPRVNNEDLDTARIVFFNELKERIKGMNMVDAALEVNHWCHEKVTYRPADSRTSAPLATLRTAFGRCGEESTFTVAALRAVGIPARQCYTPRWAHTDDNHAWVELWADGKWYFMGACEPAPKLNLAWFTFPAKRAMMVHTNVFGKYSGKESKTEYPLFTKINVLENYTDTKKFSVSVVDENNKAVPNAKLKFLLYNYAEYYPIYEQITDKNGEGYIISGLGDLAVWASNGVKYGYQKVSLKNTDAAVIKLDKEAGKEYAEDWDISPPENKAVYVNDTTADTRLNNIRLLKEDSMRNAYLATFMIQEQAGELAKKLNLNADEVKKYILKSEGNYKAISEYLTLNATDKNVLSLLSTLTDKDLRDTHSEMFQSHLSATQNPNHYPQQVFIEGVLSPRISLELIRAWRPFLQEKFKTVFNEKTTGDDVKKWVDVNIKVVDNQDNYSACIISPIGVYNIKMADKISRDVFYVALCRSLGIPTRIDAATGEIKQYVGSIWQTVNFNPQKSTLQTGKLTINYKKTGDMIPEYWSYFTLSKYENGFFNSLDFEGDKRVAAFPIRLELEEGYYCLTTGNRYADGRVLAHNEYFTVNKNKPVAKELIIRSLLADIKSYGTIKTQSISEDLYKNGMFICFMEPDREPTKHTMNDLPKFKKEFDKWNGNFVFVVPEDKLNSNFNPQSYKNLPKNSTFITQNGKEIMDEFLKAANQSFRDNYPLLYIVKPNGEIVFYSEGYRIGVGDLVLKTISTK